MNTLSVLYLNPEELCADPRNARTHSEKQIGQIATSIERFGFNNPILIDNRNQVVAGHGRLAASRKLGLEAVPAIRLEHLSAAQRKAYIIADNRLAELAGWDDETLAIELQGLLEMDLDFEITDLGFEMGEIDILLGDSTGTSGREPEEGPSSGEDVPAWARVGDLWQLGPHLLFCGDALDSASYDILLGSSKARLVFTDPPYNVPIGGHVSGLGKATHRGFIQASGEMSPECFSNFLRDACIRMRDASENGSIHFICMDWRHIADLVAAGSCVYSEFKNICVWVKSNGGMGTLYRSRHELVAVFKAGTASHRNNVQLGVHGRYRTNVWEYDGMNSFQAGRDSKLAMHPTIKPVALTADAILDCSSRGDLVLDPFAGSGTTILAAERTGRRCRAIELDPLYVDVALNRYWQMIGQAPVNLWTGDRYVPPRRADESRQTLADGFAGREGHA